MIRRRQDDNSSLLGSDAEPHIISIHERDGEFLIYGGEIDSRVYRVDSKATLATLLFTHPGRGTLLHAICSVFDHAEFETDEEGRPINILFVPKVFIKPVVRRWDTMTFEQIQESMPYQVIRANDARPPGVPFVLRLFELNGPRVINLTP